MSKCSTAARPQSSARCKEGCTVPFNTTWDETLPVNRGMTEVLAYLDFHNKGILVSLTSQS